MKTTEDFKKAVLENNIIFWPIRECSLCYTPIGYIIDHGQVSFDSSCDCVTYRSTPEPRDWENLADYYNRQDHPEIIKEYKEFWKF